MSPSLIHTVATRFIADAVIRHARGQDLTREQAAEILVNWTHAIHAAAVDSSTAPAADQVDALAAVVPTTAQNLRLELASLAEMLREPQLTIGDLSEFGDGI